MHVLITSGPASEPIDEVRRITNHSTGQTGIFLSNALVTRGHQVTCLIGANRTCRAKLHAQRIHEFQTAADLAHQIRCIAEEESIDVVLHAAALSDYVVDKITNDTGAPIIQPKISSDHTSLLIRLKQAPKLISNLRLLFPNAKLVGWKYELAPADFLDGMRRSIPQNRVLSETSEKAVEKAFEQMRENQTDACVLNGNAIGSGYLFCENGGGKTALKDLASLGSHLAQWLETT